MRKRDEELDEQRETVVRLEGELDIVKNENKEVSSSIVVSVLQLLSLLKNMLISNSRKIIEQLLYNLLYFCAVSVLYFCISALFLRRRYL